MDTWHTNLFSWFNSGRTCPYIWGTIYRLYIIILFYRKTAITGHSIHLFNATNILEMERWHTPPVRLYLCFFFSSSSTFHSHGNEAQLQGNHGDPAFHVWDAFISTHKLIGRPCLFDSDTSELQSCSHLHPRGQHRFCVSEKVGGDVWVLSERQLVLIHTWRFKGRNIIFFFFFTNLTPYK